MPRPRRPRAAAKPKGFADMTEAELQALDGERRRAVELERAQLVADAQRDADAAAQVRAAAERDGT